MNCFSALRRLRRAQKLKSENGFSLVEVMVSILIIMLAAVALAAVLTQTVAAVSFSRQSQQASNLAAAALAEVESMPWTTGTGLPNSGDANYGLTSTDVASDSNLTTDGAGGYCFEGMHVVVQGVAGAGTCSSSWEWANVSSAVELPELTGEPPVGDRRDSASRPPRGVRPDQRDDVQYRCLPDPDPFKWCGRTCQPRRGVHGRCDLGRHQQ